MNSKDLITARRIHTPLIALILVLIAFFAAGQANAQKVVAGADHTLAVKTDGTVWAWGNNIHGQLGDGTKTQRNIPVQVQGLTGVVALAAGASHSLALMSDKTVRTWGSNSSGQLGDGTQTSRTSPVLVAGLTNVVALAAGYYHSLALKSDGTVWAWGGNTNGQLGDDSQEDQTRPVQIFDLDNVKALAAGYQHSLAVKSDGTVWAWGNNDGGQLGDGTTYLQIAPVQVPNLIVRVPGSDNVTPLAAGHSYSLAVKADGTVWAWGAMTEAQPSGFVGANAGPIMKTTHYYSPVRVSGLSNVVSLAAGYKYSLALEQDGKVWAWGDNRFGQLGDGTKIPKTNPVQVLDLNGVVSLAANSFSATYSHSLAMKTDGTVCAWGDNRFGQLGDGRMVRRTSPVKVLDFGNLLSLAAGSSHVVALKSDRTVWAWGDNDKNQLGKWLAVPRSSPVVVEGLNDVVSLAACSSYSWALKSDGKVWEWGNPGFGLSGTRTIPTLVPNLSDVISLAAGPSYGLALKADRTVWAWGNNHFGQLGDGTTTLRTSPVRVLGLGDVEAVTAGSSHSLALRKSDKTVWSWGLNSSGQLGDGTLTNRTSPVPVSDLSGVVSLAAGSAYSLALKSNGTVWAWGSNSRGQLGDGTTTSRSMPVMVPNLTDVVALAASSPASTEPYSLALKSDGTVWAWGSNTFGQLGDGTTTHLKSPTRVPGLRGVVSLASGSSLILALKEDSTIVSWGDGPSGQLANGFGPISPEPRAVLGFNYAHPTPLITMTSPANQALVPLGSSVTLQTNPTVSTGSIAKVFFYADGIFLGEDATAPFSYTYTPSSWGNLDINAIAVSSAGSYSLPANIRLQTPYDSDTDELPDWLELQYAVTLEQLSAGDFDGDGISNHTEVLNGTNPLLMDTDGDGIPDGSDPDQLVAQVSVTENSFRVLSVME